MHCTSCGTETPADAAFCQNCGAPLAPHPAAQPATPTARSKAVWGAAALGLGLAVAAAAIALALFAFDDGGPKTAEATYADAARNAVERTKSLKQKADVAVANGDKAALKQAADEMKVQHAALQDLTPPPQLVEFHTTVVQQVFVIYDTAETIVVQDLPPQEALTAWEQVSAEWDVWIEQVWTVWVQEVSGTEEPTPEATAEQEEEQVEEAEVADFDGDYEGEGTVSCTDFLEGETFPLFFTVQENQLLVEDYGIVGAIDSSGSVIWTWAPDPSIHGDASATFEQDSLGEVNVEGTWSGTVSAPGPDYPAVNCTGSFTASRVS